MRQLFVLDSITAERGEIVKSARKACVRETVEWINKCEKLKEKATHWVNRIERLKEWKLLEPVVVAPPSPLPPSPLSPIVPPNSTRSPASLPTSPTRSPLVHESQSTPSSPSTTLKRVTAATKLASENAQQKLREADDAVAAETGTGTAAVEALTKAANKAMATGSKAHSQRTASPKRHSDSFVPPANPTVSPVTVSPVTPVVPSPISTPSHGLRFCPISSSSTPIDHKIFKKYASLSLPRYNPPFHQSPTPSHRSVRLVSNLTGVNPDDLQVSVTNSNQLVVRGVKLPSRDEYLRDRKSVV